MASPHLPGASVPLDGRPVDFPCPPVRRTVLDVDVDGAWLAG
ncbi:hypothetical protein [Streptomyces sp. NPDC055134]